MSSTSVLALDITILILQVTTFTSNGFILYVFFKANKLRKSFNLKLLVFLSAADFLHAITTLPYTIYLLSHWDPTRIDLDPYYVLILSAPLTAQLKVNLTLTVCIAFERILALFFPLTYRDLPYSLYTSICLIIGFLLAALDLVLEFQLSPFMKSPNCAAMGCFLSTDFLHYWGISNVVMGIIIIVLTVILIMKLKLIESESKTARIYSDKGASKIRQANCIAGGALLISLTFVTFPSIGVSSIGLLGYSIFGTVGPFYIVGLLCSGTCHSIMYLVLNRDLRKMAKKCLLGMELKMREMHVSVSRSNVARNEIFELRGKTVNTPCTKRTSH